MNHDDPLHGRRRDVAPLYSASVASRLIRPHVGGKIHTIYDTNCRICLIGQSC
ncbi:hypothetical protein BN844_3216 [Pseudomonas sp. SHC52]|nr:hypothetical protein BN844_3216 [Pseudomonas sp. SHC52]